MTHDPDAVPLAEAAASLGIPAAQLARWCADGSIGRPYFYGSPFSPQRIRFPAATMEALREAVRDQTINTPEAR